MFIPDLDDFYLLPPVFTVEVVAIAVFCVTPFKFDESTFLVDVAVLLATLDAEVALFNDLLKVPEEFLLISLAFFKSSYLVPDFIPKEVARPLCDLLE